MTQSLNRLLMTVMTALTAAASALAQTTAPVMLSEMTPVGSLPYSIQMDAQADSVQPYYVRPAQFVKNYILGQLGTVDLTQVSYMAPLSEGMLTGDQTAPSGFWMDADGYVCQPDGQVEYMAVEYVADSMNLVLTQRAGAYQQGDHDTLRIYATYQDKYFEFLIYIAFTDYNELAYSELQKQLTTLNKQTDQAEARLATLQSRQAEVRSTLDNTQARAAQYGTKYDDILGEYRFEVDTIAADVGNIQFRRFDTDIEEAYQAGVLDQQKDSIAGEMTFYQETTLPAVTDYMNALTNRLDAADAALHDLGANMAAYDQEVAALQERLMQLNQQTDTVMQRIAPLNEQYEDAQAHLTQVNARAKNYGTAFTAPLTDSQAGLQAIRSGIDALQAIRFDDEVNQAIAAYTVAEQKDSLTARMDDYAANGLPALDRQIDTLATRIATADATLDGIAADMDAYDASVQELTQRLAQLNQQNDSVQALYQAMQVHYNTVDTRYNSVKADAAPYADQLADRITKIENRLNQCNTNATLLGDMFTYFDEPVGTALSEHTVLVTGDSLKEAMRVYSDETLPWMASMIANNNLGLDYTTLDIDTLSQSIYGAAYAELTAKQAQLDATTALSDTLRTALIARYNATNEWYDEVSNAADEYNGRYDQQLADARAVLDSIQQRIDSLPELRYFGPEIEAANEAGQAELKKDSLMMDMDYYLNVTLPALNTEMEQLSASLTPLEIEFDALETTMNSYYDVYDALVDQAQDVATKTEAVQNELLPPLVLRMAETDTLIAQAEADALQYAPAYDDDIAALRLRLDSIAAAMQTLPFTDFTAIIDEANETHSADLISDSLKAAMLSYETDTLRAVRQQADLMNRQIDQLQADIRQLDADISEQQFAQLRTLQQAVADENARQQALIDSLKARNADMGQHVAELLNAAEPYGHKFDTAIAGCNARVAANSQTLLTIGYTDYNALIAASERDGLLALKKDSLMQQMDEYAQATLPENDARIQQLDAELDAAEAFIDSVETAVNNVWVTPVNGTATVTDPMGGLRNILQDQDQVRTLTIAGQMYDDDYQALTALDALEQLTLPQVNANADSLRLGSLSRLLTVTTTSQQTVLKDYVFEGCNPNLIVYAPAGATVENAHCIAVTDGQAGVIRLTDARSLRITQPFHAMQVSYTRSFTKRTYVGQSAGWESITLPFDVQDITAADGRTVTPIDATYEPAEGIAPCWLAQMDAAGFAEADQIKANVPYIIAMPNNPAYDDGQNVKGNVTFTATDTDVQPTTQLSAYQSGDYIFSPLYEADGQADVFTVNDQTYLTYQPGGAFVRSQRAARPFESYITLTSGARQRDYIPIWAIGTNDDDATPIRAIADTQSASPANALHDPSIPVYDLSGRRVTAPAKGLHIAGRRKLLVK